jgi:hypothetical protein
MADYYPGLARAARRLENNTAHVRQELYERAQSILVAQLRKQNPKISSPEIMHELAAFETAISAVESELISGESLAAVDRTAQPLPAVAQAPQKPAAVVDRAPQKSLVVADQILQSVDQSDELDGMFSSLGVILVGTAVIVGMIAFAGVIFVHSLVLVYLNVIGYSTLLVSVGLMLGLITLLSLAILRKGRIESAGDYLIRNIYLAVRRGA